MQSRTVDVDFFDMKLDPENEILDVFRWIKQYGRGCRYQKYYAQTA